MVWSRAWCMVWSSIWSGGRREDKSRIGYERGGSGKEFIIGTMDGECWSRRFLKRHMFCSRWWSDEVSRSE